MEEKKSRIPRGKSATKAKNKYRDGNYDRMECTVPMGAKILIEQAAKEAGYSSRNSYVFDAVKEKYKRDTGKEFAAESMD